MGSITVITVFVLHTQRDYNGDTKSKQDITPFLFIDKENIYITQLLQHILLKK
jgi:hypothetical protein